MATADEYAAWIVKNQTLKGTPEFDIVAKAYQEAKSVVSPISPTPTARPERSWGQAIGDIGVQLGEGVNTLLGSGFSLFAPEGDIAKSFEQGAEYWRKQQSEPLKQRMAAADVSIQKAGEEGVISQIVEAASQYYDDPALAARFVVTNLPSMIPGLGVAKLTQAAALAKGATAAKAAGLATTSAGTVNAILNAGGARAEAFQDIKKTLIEQGYSPAEAERKAIEDSRLVAAVGGATGFISGKTGLEKVITGGVTKGGLRAGVGKAVGELAGEQAEEVLPKLATNIQAAEYDARSLGKDIGRTIVETGIASGPGAALSGVMGARGERPEVPPTGEVPPTTPTVPPTGEAPEIQAVRDRLAARGFSEEDIDRILAERTAREALKEPTDATATTLPADVPAVTEAQPGVGEPSVGVPSGDLGRPTTAEPAAPVGRGLERPVTPPAPRVEPETTIPTELTETPSGTQAPETIQAKEKRPAQPAAPAPTAVEAPAPTPPVEEKPARYQRLRAEQPWYSALDKAIEASPQKAAPAPQWKNVLTGMVNKGQAKRDEIEWTGVEDWLALQQGRVTKEQIQDYLKQGGVRVEETVLGDNKDALSRIRAEWAKLPEAAGYSIEYDPVSENYEYIDPNGDNVDQLPTKLQEAVNKHFSGTSSDTKYGQYTLPGGENYREVLLTLPTQAASVEGKIVKDGKDSKYPWAIIVNGEEVNRVSDEAVAKDVLEGELTRARKQRGKEDSSTYRSSHWDQPNVLAHIRVNDRTDADGKKVLFVEEIQSDWGQEGKKKGFRKEEDPRIAALKEQRKQWLADPEKRSEVWQLNAEINRLGGSITPGGETGVVVGNVPAAPFVTKTEGWLNLALKRVLTMAAEGGYDKVAFINGQQAHERFPQKEDGTSTKESFDKYYNQIIPQALNKLLPKVGGGRVSTVVISPTDEGQFLRKVALGLLAKRGIDAGLQQPGFDITPAMREKLAGGLPLFQKEGEEQPPQKTGKYPLPAEAIEALKDNSLTMALDAIENSKPSEINKAIAARVKMLLRNTQVTIDDDLRDSKGNPVLGAASTSGSRIWLDANRGMNMETVLHESVHAATERILSTPKDQRTPEQNAAVQELTDLWNAAKANSDIKLTPEASDSLSEFVAEGMTNIELQDQLASVKWESKTMWDGFKRILLNMLGIKTPASMLDYTLASVDTIFAAVPKAAAPATTTTKAEAKEEPKVLQKPKLTAEEKAKKEAEEADAKVTEAMRKFAESKTSEEAAKAASTLQSLRSSTTAIPQLRRLYDSLSNLGRRGLVQALPTDFLAELASKNVPELQRTTSLLGRMSGMREQLLHGASQTSDRISRAFKKDPLLRGRLEEVVYASTLAQIDPSTNKISEKLNTLYKALGEEGQTIYKDARDYYTDMGDLYSQLIKSNVERSGASEEAKSAILAKLKVMFEPANRMRPYFPLMREGNYWFSSGKGKNRRFHMFETMPERDAALEAFARSEGKSLQDMKETSEVKFGNDVSSLREISQNTDQSLTDVLALVDKLDTGSAASKKELLDSVYQMYLNSLPEQSFRKHYITREGTAGFRTDFLRNFSQSAIQMSGQLARVKYGPQIRASLSGAKASIENQPQYEPYVKEMTKRAERDLVPPARTSLDAVSDVLTKWTYIHYLSSVSSALLQPVGILQTALPVLGGRYGYGKTAAEVAKLAKVWDSFSTTRNLPDGTTTTVFPTVANSKAINASPLEKRAINEMLARDVSQSTMARELYGYRAKPTDRVNTKLDKGIKGANFLMGGLMHHTERVAREIVFLASYRLNIQAGKSHEAAVDAAVKDTQDSLGNYSQYARPLIMRNPGGKIVLQFSTYPLHIASFLANNFYKMIPFLNKEGKAEAAKIFFGTLGTTWILAGAAGFPAPVSAVLMGFISFMFKALGDDDEMPDELRSRDFPMWFNEVWLPSQLGHIEVFGHKLSDVVKTGVVNVAGWDFASRTGLNNLFLREQKETKTPREGLQAMIIDKSGPSINMMLSYADGIQAFKEGDYQRAVEKIAPAAVRSVAQTYRFTEEGAKDIKGNELITKGDFTTGELLGRAIGFQPSRLANLQKVNAEVKQDEIKMTNERNELLRMLDIANRKGAAGDKQYNEVLDKIDKFNDKYADYPKSKITSKTEREYLKKKEKERTESERGLTVTKKTPVGIERAIELSRNYGISKKEESTNTPDYGLRVDGTPKAQGFFGELKRPDGDVSTELSIGVNIGGKEMEIPSIVPTLTKKELNFLLSDGPSSDPIMQSIEDKAVEHAKKRIKAGLSPFATPNERVLPTPK